MTRDSDRTIEVDGERFQVRATPEGSRHFNWLSGPNPGYGFSSGGHFDAELDDASLTESIRTFLAQVDPVTGYIED